MKYFRDPFLYLHVIFGYTVLLPAPDKGFKRLSNQCSEFT